MGSRWAPSHDEARPEAPRLQERENEESQSPDPVAHVSLAREVATDAVRKRESLGAHGYHGASPSSFPRPLVQCCWVVHPLTLSCHRCQRVGASSV